MRNFFANARPRRTAYNNTALAGGKEQQHVNTIVRDRCVGYVCGSGSDMPNKLLAEAFTKLE
ncbi:MAG: hypothetical protein U0Y96_00820 [Candidatus Kapaibacterium sp.]